MTCVKGEVGRAIPAEGTRTGACCLSLFGIRIPGSERCTNIKVDYVKSLTMLKALGRTAEYNSLVTSLKSRAAGGNPKAIAALQKLGIPLD